MNIIANRCGRIQEKHFEGKKTLRNFRDILEERLLRLGNEKSGLHKTVQKKSRGKEQKDEKKEKSGGARAGVDSGDDGVRGEGNRA